MNLKFYRSSILKIINQDSTIIKLTRKTYQDDGYGGRLSVIKNIKVKGRFYNKNNINEITMIDGATIGHSSTAGVKLLAGHNADIEEGDRVKWQGREYRINTVKNYFDICKQCHLDAIKNEN